MHSPKLRVGGRFILLRAVFITWHLTYFSLTTYAIVGYGAVLLDRRWQLLEGPAKGADLLL